jgi:hypothetical protein
MTTNIEAACEEIFGEGTSGDEYLAARMTCGYWGCGG